ncbi:hypothetical protein OCV99_12460 [Dorea acetigenes]|uniref:CbbX protein n=1 Tax=Dorea acetigenes TaxID=2981787 RepID=A0ABT2RPK1_9FIRM|nr:hypothetical protein [Dorea acetigenes]MCU6687340.1 hypothetical protein [Dorea acetigenes]SCJ37195.1 CbbX protein [uncultured Clostridium sp.]
MDKYEYRVKTEQMLEHMEKKQYSKAMEIADTIDWRRVKSISMLNSVSEIYEACGENKKSRDILFLAFDRSPSSRKIVFRLGTLALKIQDVEEASSCYEEFVKLAPKDPNQYILKYKILKARNAPLEEQIKALEDFKKEEYEEKWAYELAKLYDEAGKSAECLEECDDLILWFSEGKYVYQAMELKMKYKPLTPLQKEKYENRILEEEEPEPVTDETPEDTEENTEESAKESAEEVKEEPEDLGKTRVFSVKQSDKTGAETDETLRISGQMKIEEILQEWEEKQKANAEAIADQKKKDEEVLLERRRAEEKRKEEEARRLEEQQRAAEEARKIAEQKAAEEARRLEEQKAAEEARKIAEQKAADEAYRLAEQEARRLVEKRTEKEMTPDLQELMRDLEEGELAQKKAEPDAEEVKEEVTEALDEEGSVLKEFDYAEKKKEKEEESIFGNNQYDEPEYVDDYDDDDIETDYDEPESDEEEEFENLDVFDTGEFEDIEDEDEFEDFEEEEDVSIELDEEELRAKIKEVDIEIEEPTEEEIQRRIKKGKTGVPFDTGFVVTGRYDLSATSEIGLKAGLTEEQKKLFSYFVPVRGMSEQIVEVLDNDRREQREGTSRVGNILVIGQKGSGKTVLAVDIVKAIQKQRNLKQGKVAIVTGESLNKKDLSDIIQKLRGGAIIVEKAGKMNTKTVEELNYLMEKKTGELLFVLEDQRKPLERLFTANPAFKRKFTSTLELPVFVNDELVTFGQTYAKENGYKLDEMGILALYSRIDVMQREDHNVTVAEVKEIMDAAIEHSQKANVKHLARRMFGKGTDKSDRIILKEEDFRI